MTSAANLAIFGQTVQYSTASNAPFTVGSSGGGGLQLVYNNAGGGNIASLNGGGLSFSTFTGAVGSEVYTQRIIVDSNGNIGIGTGSVSSGNIVSVSGGNIFVAGSIRIGNSATQNGNIVFRLQ